MGALEGVQTLTAQEWAIHAAVARVYAVCTVRKRIMSGVSPGAVAGGQTSPHGVLSIACGVALRVVLGIILFGIALLPAVIATKCAPRKAQRPPNVRLSGGLMCAAALAAPALTY